MRYPANGGISDIFSFIAILWQMSSTFIYTSCFLIFTLANLSFFWPYSLNLADRIWDSISISFQHMNNLRILKNLKNEKM